MAEKQTNKDRMREIVDSIENGIKELFESDITTVTAWDFRSCPPFRNRRII